MISNQVVFQSGERSEYPYLVSVADAKANILRRRAILESLNPQTGALMTEQWFQFIDQVELPFIHLDPAELWMITGELEFLHGALEAFETPSNQIDTLGTNDAWLLALDIAQIDPNDLARKASPLRLMGYSWGVHALPWES